MSRSYYLGPYVETRSPMGPETVAMTSCTNTSCEVNRKRMPRERGFCNRCGSPVDMIRYERQAETVDADEVRSLLGEALMDWGAGTEGRRVWTPNLTDRGEPRRFEVEPEGETGAAPLDAEDLPDRERDWLRAAFAAELGVLTKAYGAENVQVRWGLVWMWT